jgi:hypothetical protein
MKWTPALIQKTMLRAMTNMNALAEFDAKGCAMLPTRFQFVVAFDLDKHKEPS